MPKDPKRNFLHRLIGRKHKGKGAGASAFDQCQPVNYASSSGDVASAKQER